MNPADNENNVDSLPRRREFGLGSRPELESTQGKD